MAVLFTLLTIALVPAVQASADPDTKGDASIMILGGITFMMLIYYYVNCHHKAVALNTWALVSTAVSIFCAVLFYSAVTKLVNFIFGLDEPTVPPTTGNIVNSAVQFVTWWFIVELVLFFVRHSLLHLKGYGTIGGHIMGFAALQVCGELCQIAPFNTAPYFTVLIICFEIGAIAALFMASKSLFNCVIDEDDDEGAWHAQAHDTGMDFFGLTTGFMLAWLVRFCIVGNWWSEHPLVIPTIDGELGGHSTLYVLTLFGFGIFFLLLSVLLAVSHSGNEGRYTALIEWGSSTISMAAAFCLLFSIMWAVRDDWSVVLCHVLVACLLTLIGMVFVIFISFTAQYAPGWSDDLRALRGAFSGVSLAVGLSWEKVFDASLDGIHDSFLLEKFSDRGKDAIVCMMAFALFFIVFPAWMVYMLTKSDADLQKALSISLARGPLPCMACCCDDGLYDDDMYPGSAETDTSRQDMLGATS